MSTSTPRVKPLMCLMGTTTAAFLGEKLKSMARLLRTHISQTRETSHLASQLTDSVPSNTERALPGHSYSSTTISGRKCDVTSRRHFHWESSQAQKNPSMSIHSNGQPYPNSISCNSVLEPTMASHGSCFYFAPTSFSYSETYQPSPC